MMRTLLAWLGAVVDAVIPAAHGGRVNREVRVFGHPLPNPPMSSAAGAGAERPAEVCVEQQAPSVGHPQPPK